MSRVAELDLEVPLTVDGRARVENRSRSCWAARWSRKQFDMIAETSQFADHLARPHLLRFFADGWPALLVSNVWCRIFQIDDRAGERWRQPSRSRGTRINIAFRVSGSRDARAGTSPAGKRRWSLVSEPIRTRRPFIKPDLWRTCVHQTTSPQGRCIDSPKNSSSLRIRPCFVARSAR